jgi:hypothetical protein
MLEYLAEDVRGFLRDDSRRPFLMYWLALAIVIADIAAHYKWDAVFGPHIRGVGVAIVSSGRFTIFLCPEVQIIISVIFVACMLKWAELGILFALLYLLFVKSLLYVTLIGLYTGIRAIDQSVEIPTYLFVWEAALVLGLIVYMLRKDAVVRSVKHKVYQSTHFADGDSGFGPLMLEGLTTDMGPFDLELPRQPGEYRRHESVVVEGSPGRKNVRRQYKIQDGPEGRVFIVKDSATGEAMNYRSLDEMPAHHRDAFGRMLRVAGQMKSKVDAGEVAGPGFTKRVEQKRQYKIEDGPEGRRFIVGDPASGASRTYRSLDEMPARHREVFVRTLKSTGLWRDEH